MSDAASVRYGIRLPAGHRAAVLGAGGAIGRACVRAFAAAGATVWAIDLDAERAASAVADLGGEHQHAVADVTDPQRLTDVAHRIGAVDSVVYAAGIVYDAYLWETDWTAYRRVMAVNLDGACHTGAAFVRPMLAAGSAGAFVFIASMAGLRGEAGATAYCASKFGLIGMIESFAAEVAGRGVRVNAVCPGNVDSPMLRAVAADIARREGRDPEETLRGQAFVGAARRLVETSEVADICLYLCSPLASAITGTAVRVDCGALIG